MLKYGGIKNHTIDYFVWCIWCFGGGLFELVIPAQGFVASVVSLDSSWWKDLGTMKSVQLGKLHCPRIYLQEFRNPPSKIKRIANSSSLTKPTQCVFQKNIVQLKPWKHWNLPFVCLIRWIKAAPPKRCRRRGAITKAKWWQMFGLCLRPSVCMEIWSGFWLEDDFSSSRCGFNAETAILISYFHVFFEWDKRNHEVMVMCSIYFDDESGRNKKWICQNQKSLISEDFDLLLPNMLLPPCT